MQIVIEIPNSLYANLNKIQRGSGSIASKRILDCVKNGILLPKGHGDLIDKSMVLRKAKSTQTIVDVNNVPTIIKADKGE